MKSFAVACGMVAMMAAVVSAEEKKDAGATTALSMGAAVTAGNSETMQLNAALITERGKTEVGSLRAGLEGNYGESTVGDAKDTTVDNARGFLNLKKPIAARTSGVLDTTVLYDNVALVDYRATLAPGLGQQLVKTDLTDLSMEAGPAYVWEEVADVRDDYLALRIAERLTCKMNGAAKAWQSVEYLPRADELEDFLLNAELGAEAAMNARIKLRVVLQNKHDSRPAADLRKNDVSLIAGLSLAL